MWPKIDKGHETETKILLFLKYLESLKQTKIFSTVRRFLNQKFNSIQNKNIYIASKIFDQFLYLSAYLNDIKHRLF